MDYGVKPLRLGGAEVRVNLFDLAGGDAFKTVRMEFYKDAQGLLLVYDAGDRASFEALERWAGEAREGGAAGGAPVVVVGNKAELPAAAVPADEGRAWAEGRGWAFFEASAATGGGVRGGLRDALSADAGVRARGAGPRHRGRLRVGPAGGGGGPGPGGVGPHSGGSCGDGRGRETAEPLKAWRPGILARRRQRGRRRRLLARRHIGCIADTFLHHTSGPGREMHGAVSGGGRVTGGCFAGPGPLRGGPFSVFARGGGALSALL